MLGQTRTRSPWTLTPGTSTCRLPTLAASPYCARSPWLRPPGVTTTIDPCMAPVDAQHDWCAVGVGSGVQRPGPTDRGRWRDAAVGCLSIAYTRHGEFIIISVVADA